ncbi:hypothetical protein BN2497_2725 [Janthinobacterium sp. CG23_2]|nr:hypothetical protein BN2497_2725 [Janthinobacterium sp. CG23_2]CUU27760.1 hypothetical protein BN3177_2725 [Janthinobacterium sp. CG23_2]
MSALTVMHPRALRPANHTTKKTPWLSILLINSTVKYL